MTQRVYCIAQFEPKPGKLEELFRVLQALEPETLREEGCIQYRITRHIPSPFAEGSSFPLVFNEIWANMAVFEAHCQKPYIQRFFDEQCISADGLVAQWNVCVYSDELPA